MADMVLTSTVRANLLALQDTASLLNRTQRRLSTGLAVSGASDDPLKFFSAKTLLDRSADLAARKDGIDQGVNTLREGGDKLRLADINEEGANLLALQTSQQLGIQALSFAGQAEQSILALFS